MSLTGAGWVAGAPSQIITVPGHGYPGIE